MFGVIKVSVKKEGTFYRKMPANLEIDGTKHYENNEFYKCPELYVYEFKRINFLPDGTLFWRYFPMSRSFPFFHKRLKHHNAKGIYFIRKNWKSVELKRQITYLVIHDQWTKNYYHWITQALPRLLLAYKLKREFTLLLPEDHDSEFHKRSLEILGIYDWIKLETNRTYYKVYDLIYPSHDLQIGDYHDDLIRELSSQFRSSVGVRQSVFLFIHRPSKNGRRILNEEEVLKTFSSYGFEIVEFEKISFDEQITLAGSASILAGVHGAGLTNMIFMPEGGKVFELTTRLQGDQYYYFTLSNAMNHSYYYQLCQADDNGKTIQDANFTVDIKKLCKNIEQMIAGNE